MTGEDGAHPFKDRRAGQGHGDRLEPCREDGDRIENGSERRDEERKNESVASTDDLGMLRAPAKFAGFLK